MATGSDGARFRVQGLDGIGRVDHSADTFRESEERHHVLPVPAPALGDCRIALAPGSGIEVIEGLQAGRGVPGFVNGFEGGHGGLPVLSGHKVEGMTDQVHDAGLHDGLRKDGGDGLGKALQAVDNRDQDVGDPGSSVRS